MTWTWTATCHKGWSSHPEDVVLLATPARDLGAPTIGRSSSFVMDREGILLSVDCHLRF